MRQGPGTDVVPGPCAFSAVPRAAGALRVISRSARAWGPARDQPFGVQYSVSLPAPCSTLFQEPGNSTTA